MIKSFTYQLNQICPIQQPEVDESDYSEFSKKVRFLEILADVENSSVSVLDMNLKKYIFLRSKFIDRFDDQEGGIIHDDPSYYTSLIHHLDLPRVLDSYKKTFSYIMTLPSGERKDYKLILNFRQRDRFGKYLNIILQLVVLELDRNGNIWLVLILDDLLTDKISFSEVNYRLVNIKTGKLCQFNSEMDNIKRKILSDREIEVLELVSRGFVSKEIAHKLFVSVSTVNNHRQNILDKINAANTSEAVAYARNLGLL